MRWLLSALIAVSLSGCGVDVVCYDLTDEQCRAGTEAAEAMLTPGYVQLTVGQGVGWTNNPAPVLACYPDGSAIALEVAFDGDAATAGPYSGEGELEDLCSE